MRITSLVDNTTHCNLAAEHGLSLHITLEDGKTILFDMGQSNLFAENAKNMGINISQVDIAIVSHGHYDHGGGFPTFLSLNAHAPIFIHSKAFEAHYSLKEYGLKYIGIADKITKNNQMIFSDQSPFARENSLSIGNGLTLLWGVEGNYSTPPGNTLLFGPDEKTNDNFSHEQSLIIEEADKVILIAGCAHKGIINIMLRAESICKKKITHVFAGMHLKNNGLGKEDEKIFVNTLCNQLKTFDGCQFFTMHCTGEDAYQMMRNNIGSKINYLSVGQSINL